MVILLSGTLPSTFEPPYILVIVPPLIFKVVLVSILASSPPPNKLWIVPPLTFVVVFPVSANFPPPYEVVIFPLVILIKLVVVFHQHYFHHKHL